MDIFDYSNFCDFMRAYFEEKKSENPSFSYEAWARKLEGVSKSSLVMVLGGKRVPGKDFVEKLIEYYHFSREEAQYFRCLVSLSKVSADGQLEEKLTRHAKAHLKPEPYVTLDANKCDGIMSYESVVLPELIKLKSFKEDYKWLSEKFFFNKDEHQLKECMDQLEASGIVERESDGTLKPPYECLWWKCDELTNKKYLDEVSDIASLVRDAVPVTSRLTDDNAAPYSEENKNANIFPWSIMCMKEENIPEVQKILYDCLNKIRKLEDMIDGDSVIFCNMQFFDIKKPE